MRNSNWTGTFTATMQESGYENGSGYFEGDLNFTIFIAKKVPVKGSQPGTPSYIPPFATKIPMLLTRFPNTLSGTFRCSVKANSKIGYHPPTYGTIQTYSGKAEGTINGSYDPATNTVVLSAWFTIPTQVNGTLVAVSPNQLEKGAHPQYTINNTLTPIGDPTYPQTYLPPAAINLGPNMLVGYDAPSIPTIITIGAGADKPITLSLNNRDTQYAVQNHQGNGDLGSPAGTTRITTWTFILTPPKYNVQLDLDPPELNPTPAQLKTPATNQLSSKLKVTVTANGKPDTSRDVEITICTGIGGALTDGHLHDNRSDPCDQSRPVGEIPGDDGSPTNNYPVTKTTDGNGEINTTYSPPNISVAGGKYICGTDQITVVVQDPTIQDKTDLTHEQDIITRVPGLGPMPGALDGTGGTVAFPLQLASYQSYYFVPQVNGPHGLMFYGTPATNASIANIAGEFISAQIACQNGAAYPAATPNAQVFTTPGGPKALRITAMSLPWGGLLDIDGNWSTPHVSHNTGTMVDIGFNDFATQDPSAPYDMNRLLLLHTIIEADSNFGSFGVGEGDDMTPGGPTFTNPHGPHFHVNFKL